MQIFHCTKNINDDDNNYDIDDYDNNDINASIAPSHNLRHCLHTVTVANLILRSNSKTSSTSSSSSSFKSSSNVLTDLRPVSDKVFWDKGDEVFLVFWINFKPCMMSEDNQIRLRNTFVQWHYHSCAVCISQNGMNCIHINATARHSASWIIHMNGFTVQLHVMQRTLLWRPLCPSVCQMHALWQNERNLCPHSYTIMKEPLFQ